MSSKIMETARQRNTFFYYATGCGMWLEVPGNDPTDAQFINSRTLLRRWLRDRVSLVYYNAPFYSAMRYYPAYRQVKVMARRVIYHSYDRGRDLWLESIDDDSDYITEVQMLANWLQWHNEIVSYGGDTVNAMRYY